MFELSEANFFMTSKQPTSKTTSNLKRSVIDAAEHIGESKRRNYIAIKHHNLHYDIQSWNIKVVHTPGADNPSDEFTKALATLAWRTKTYCTLH